MVQTFDLSVGINELRTESDVEQKVIFPLLTASNWLGFETTEIRTKEYMVPLDVDKGRKKITWILS